MDEGTFGYLWPQMPNSSEKEERGEEVRGKEREAQKNRRKGKEEWRSRKVEAQAQPLTKTLT